MNLDELTQVWTPEAAALAVASGVIYGLVVGWFARSPDYSSGVASATRIASLTTIFAISAGLLFYAGQTLAAYLVDDPSWTRVPSRFGAWVLFSLALGVVTWILVRRDKAERRRRAHDRAVSERAREAAYHGEGDH